MADVYLVACCFIYLVEGQPSWKSAIEQSIRSLNPTTKLVTSQLARLECRVKPVRDGDTALVGRYDALFGAGRVFVVDVSARVIDRATSLRARFGFKAPDAIHLATAIESRVSRFWTGDAGLAKCTDIPVTMIGEVTP